jgi:hypothetical protein
MEIRTAPLPDLYARGKNIWPHVRCIVNVMKTMPAGGFSSSIEEVHLDLSLRILVYYRIFIPR